MTVAPTSARPGPEQHHARWALVVLAAFLLGGMTVAVLFQLDVLGSSSSSSNPSTSTTQGSGTPATQARDLAAFHAVELAGSNNVVIRLGGKQSVVVRADDNLLDRVTTEVQSGTLAVGTTPGSLTTKSPMAVEVTVPALDSLTLSGSGNIVVEGIAADSLQVTLPGSGTVTGSGAAKRLDVTVGGSGAAQFTRLVADDVHAVVSGSGAIFVNATAKLDASVSGSGAIVYIGSPQSVTRNVTGTGAITGS